jgi:hypothetical protein
MKRKLLILLALVALVSWLPGQANATNTLFSGYLTTDTGDANFGILATFGWAGANPNGFEIDWTVASISGGYTYSYTVSADGGGDLAKGLSHIILQVSESAKIGDFSTFSFPYTANDPQKYTTSGSSGSNPNMPADIYGFKFSPLLDADKLKFTFSFNSIREPMWGNFYAKDGNAGPVTAWNTGLDTTYTGDGKGMQISVPDTKTVVPLPGAMLLLGAGLCRLAAYARRRQED